MIDYIILLIVGILWGLTDYLLEYFFNNTSEVKEKDIVLKGFKFVVKNYKPILCFLLNKSASILFYFSMRTLSLSLTVMISNTSSFITSTLCEIIHKKKKFGYKFILGMNLIVTGIGLCLYNKEELNIIPDPSFAK